MDITDRDRKLLFDIQDYGLLTTKQISFRHFPGVALTTVLRRLRVLNSYGYIKKIEGLKNGGHAWCISENLKVRLNSDPAKVHFPKQILDHDLALALLRMNLEESKIALAWKPEHVIRSEMAKERTHRQIRTMNVPDGLMGIARPNGHKEAVVIELELTAKSQARYREIFTNYIQKREVWAFWFVVKKATIGRQIEQAANVFRFQNGPRLYLSIFDEVLNAPRKARVFNFDRIEIAENLFTQSKPKPAHANQSTDNNPAQPMSKVAAKP